MGGMSRNKALLRRIQGNIARKPAQIPPKFLHAMLGAYPRSSVERWGAFVYEIVMKIAQKTRYAIQEEVFPDLRDAFPWGRNSLDRRYQWTAAMWRSEKSGLVSEHSAQIALTAVADIPPDSQSPQARQPGR
jgi:hypothetical protein